MDNWPMFSMSEEQRQSQYLADVNQENEERQRRNENALDPGAQETRNRWNANQVDTHEKTISIQRQLDNIDVSCRK